MRIHLRVRNHSVIAGALAAAMTLSVAGYITFGPVTRTTASVKTTKLAGPVAEAGPGRVSEQSASQADETIVLASPGRIEGRSDTVEVGASIDGVIESIHVKEGSHVVKGQPLAEL